LNPVHQAPFLIRSEEAVQGARATDSGTGAQPGVESSSAVDRLASMSSGAWVVVLSLAGGCLEVFGILLVLGALDRARQAATGSVDVRRLELSAVSIILGVLCLVAATIVGSGPF
jgi:hypothetical protein